MKKILGIIVIGLLLSGNAYAATEKNYLICEDTVKENFSKGAIKGEYPIGEVINTEYLELIKKKTKATLKVTRHWPGLYLWQSSKAEKQGTLKGSLKDNDYIFNHSFSNNGKDHIENYKLYKIDNSWNIDGYLKWDGFMNEYVEFKFISKCKEYEKKEFINLRKLAMKKPKY